jgi:hypothetical protein
MSQQNETGFLSVQVDGAITQYLRVKASDATTDPITVTTAGIADDDIGVIEQAGLAAGDVVALRHRTAQGTVKMVASGAVTAGAKVYTAASGKITATWAASARLRGIALEPASGNNSVIEVLPANLGLASIA